MDIFASKLLKVLNHVKGKAILSELKPTIKINFKITTSSNVENKAHSLLVWQLALENQRSPVCVQLLNVC